jgi:hypothetical protein
MLVLKAVAQSAGMADGTASTLPNSCIEIPPLMKRRRAMALCKMRSERRSKAIVMLQGGQKAKGRRAKAHAKEEKGHRQVPKEAGRLIFNLPGRWVQYFEDATLDQTTRHTQLNVTK